MFGEIILIISYIGILLSLLANLLVLFALVKVIYKDISTYLRLYCAIIDIVHVALIIFYLFLTTDLEMCISNFTFLFTISAHGYWVFYMSLVLYQIICLKKEITEYNASIAFGLTNFISALVICPYFFILRSEECLTAFNGTFNDQYFDAAILAPEFIIVILIGFFYYKIKKVIFSNTNNQDQNSKILYQRIHGYLLLFLLFLIANILSVVEAEVDETYDILHYARMLIYSYYSFFDSLLYGMTLSFKRTILHTIKRDVEYEEQEEYLNELRKEKLIFPRIYYDLMNKNEDSLFGSISI